MSAASNVAALSNRTSGAVEVQQSIRVQILQVNPQSTLRHCLIRQSMCETPSNPGKYGFDLMAKAVFDPVD
jgi:hypothetical protein